MSSTTAETKTQIAAGPMVAGRDKAGTVTSLSELAERIRECQELGQDVAILLGRQPFVLRFSQNLCFTAGSLSAIDHTASTQQAIPVEPVGMTEPDPELSARPLADFLWRLGSLAGRGRVLPWLSSGATYQLSREPESKASGQFVTLLAAIRERGLPPLMIAQETKYDLPVIFDFLNACSVEGCLKIVAPPKPDAKNHPLYELTLQGPLPEIGEEIEPQQRGLLNLLGALRRLSGE